MPTTFASRAIGPAPIYLVIACVDGVAVPAEADDIADLPVTITGINLNPRQRIELQHQPRLAGYAGPCWGGESADGRPIIRYEAAALLHAL